jgi:hypothetical protein
MNLLSLALLGTGGVLIYCAVKGQDPRDVVRAALAGQSLGAQPAKYALPAVSDFAPSTTPVPTTPGV